MTIENFKDDIRRAYRVLGIGMGSCQNDTDIRDWHKRGYITNEEKNELLTYNLQLYKKAINAKTDR